MENTTQDSGRRSSERKGRNNNNNRNRSRGPRGRRPAPDRKPKKKQNPILAFFSKLFGAGKKTGNKKTSSGRSERPERTRSAEEVMPEINSPRLYVGNLSYDTTESDLFDHFAGIGQVKNAEIVRDRGGNRSKGFGFVEMSSVEMAKTASERLHRTDFQGRQIIVSGAKK